MRKPRILTCWSIAAEELEVAVRPLPRQVAGAVEALAPAAAPKGSGTKRSAVSSGPPQVAARQARAAEAELPGDPDRQRLARARSST